MQFWGAQAASLQVSAACRDWEIGTNLNSTRKGAVAGRAADNYRLAACAPPKAERARWSQGTASPFRWQQRRSASTQRGGYN